MKSERITIIVLNWNRPDDTIACLESLDAADLDGASVLVVDNGSTDDSVDNIRERFAHRTILELAENRGYAGGNNAGIRLALETGAEGVVLLNNDTRVAPDFLPPLLATAATDARTGAVSSAIMRMDRPDMLDVAFAAVHFHQREAVRILGVNALPGEGFDERRRVEVAIGCSLLLTAEALEQVGLFDEDFFAYHEDVDWCLRAHQAGFHVYFEPFSRVFHRGSQSTRSDERPQPAADSHDAQKCLPNAEPLPWNPVRTYLGARNTILLLRRHATRQQKLAFLRASVIELPLAFFAAVKGREGWLRLGRWGYCDLLRQHFVLREPPLGEPAPAQQKPSRSSLRLLWTIPVDLFWTLPRQIFFALRDGRTAEYFATLRGLRDGLLRRPLPLERLGLR